MRVLLLGANGFIGSAIAFQLLREGHDVIGVGRARHRPAGFAPIAWVQGDLNRMIRSVDWLPHFAGVNAVINASGALQSGARDHLARSQGDAIVALIDACEQAGIRHFVQISAPGADATASTEFMRTKARADAHLKASSLAWTVLRPGLVIGRGAFGGTALIRALAAFPLIVPLVRSSGRIQTVALSDVARIAVAAAAGKIAPGNDLDLVEDDPHGVRDIVLAHRRWLGLPDPLAILALPGWAAAIVGFKADLLGWLGWRSPLRSTALRIMRADVLGDPVPAKALFGTAFAGLSETLEHMPSSQQDRWHARLYLLLPLIVACLAILWIGSGLIGFARIHDAASILVIGGIDESRARLLVAAGAAIDIALGVAILVRRLARPAALGMAAVTLAYMLGSLAFRPDLWLDPLGTMLKTLPVLALSLVAATILEER